MPEVTNHVQNHWIWTHIYNKDNQNLKGEITSLAKKRERERYIYWSYINENSLTLHRIFHGMIDGQDNS